MAIWIIQCILRGKKWPAHYSKAYSNRSDRQIWLYNMSFVIICQIDSTFRWGFWQWWQQTHTPPFPKSAIWSVWITSQNEWGKNIRSFSRLKISIRLTMSIISIQRKWLSQCLGLVKIKNKKSFMRSMIILSYQEMNIWMKKTIGIT